MAKVSLAYVAILVTTVLWASSLIFAKLIFEELGPIVFVALRYTLAKEKNRLHGHYELIGRSYL